MVEIHHFSHFEKYIESKPQAYPQAKDASKGKQVDSQRVKEGSTDTWRYK